MKLSIWQQFSSNHSSSFTIVGEFPSCDDAERAADTIRGMLEKISEWYAEHPEEPRESWERRMLDEPLTPPEKELILQYNVEWNEPIDWFHGTKIETQLDRFVFITSSSEIDHDGKPFDEIMNRLGGVGYYDGELYGDARFNLVCVAPNEMAAQRLAETLSKGLYHDKPVRHEGTTLYFDGWSVYRHPSLTKLISTLSSEGCTSIQLTFYRLPPISLPFDDNDNTL